MKSLTETVCVTRWQVFVMLAMSSYAVGAIAAKVTTTQGC